MSNLCTKPSDRIAGMHPDTVVRISGDPISLAQLYDEFNVTRPQHVNSWDILAGCHCFRKIESVEIGYTRSWVRVELTNGHRNIILRLAGKMEGDGPHVRPSTTTRLLLENGLPARTIEAVLPDARVLVGELPKPPALRGWDYVEKSSRYENKPRQYHAVNVELYETADEEPYYILNLESGGNALFSDNQIGLDQFGIYITGV
jgi:hypothetical protein